jgi:hypothetical protein
LIIKLWRIFVVREAFESGVCSVPRFATIFALAKAIDG